MVIEVGKFKWQFLPGEEGGGGCVLKMRVSPKVNSIIWTTTSEINNQSFLQSMQLIILMSVQQTVPIFYLKDNTHCLCCHNC